MSRNGFIFLVSYHNQYTILYFFFLFLSEYNFTPYFYSIEFNLESETQYIPTSHIHSFEFAVINKKKI